MTLLSQRVARGTALLDSRRPGWADTISTEIHMWSPFTCVLAQLYGTYQCGYNVLNRPHSPFSYGFDISVFEIALAPFVYWRLGRAWKREIKSRQRAI